MTPESTHGTLMNTLLEWIDNELEYHELMLRSVDQDSGQDEIFTEHNVAHLHLTQLRKLVSEKKEETGYVHP